MRSAVSRVRVAARATSRLATLTHAISSRIATPPNSASSTGRSWRTPSSCRPTVLIDPSRRSVVGELARDLRGDAVDLPPRLLERHARLHPADDAQVVLAARRARVDDRVQDLVGLQIVGHARVRRHHQPEPGRHHADDGVRLVVDLDAPADDRRIAAEAALERRPAQENRPRRRLRLLLVVGTERAAERGVGAEHREEIGRDEARCAAARDCRRR